MKWGQRSKTTPLLVTVLRGDMEASLSGWYNLLGSMLVENDVEAKGLKSRI